MTLIFFTIYPLNADFEKKYGFGYLQSCGHEILILNVFQLLHLGTEEELPHYLNLTKVSELSQIPVKTIEELECHVLPHKENALAFFLCERDNRLLALLMKCDIPYALYLNHWLNLQSKQFYDGVLRALQEPYRLIELLKRRWIRKPFQSLPQSYQPRLVITRDSSKLTWLNNAATDVIEANSLDFDRVKEDADRPRPQEVEGVEYLVWLMNSPWDVHDNVLRRAVSLNKEIISKERYTDLVNVTLSKIERQTGLPIVIAAYPKATRSEDIYNGRKFLYDTERLVRYSSGVAGHHTGAINFAVLHNKPLCLIGIKRVPHYSIFYRTNQRYASLLRLPLFNMDQKSHLRLLERGNTFSVVNEEVRQAFLNRFIRARNKTDRSTHVLLGEYLSSYERQRSGSSGVNSGLDVLPNSAES